MSLTLLTAASMQLAMILQFAAQVGCHRHLLTAASMQLAIMLQFAAQVGCHQHLLSAQVGGGRVGA
jgi:hypothetical protein